MTTRRSKEKRLTELCVYIECHMACIPIDLFHSFLFVCVVLERGEAPFPPRSLAPSLHPKQKTRLSFRDSSFLSPSPA
jgi:hypothetical protein